MKLQEYKPLALRTLAELGNQLHNSIHMTLGVGSEFLKELLSALEKDDEVNIQEELGDMSWFAVCYSHIWGFEIDKTLLGKIIEGNDSEDILILAFKAIGHLQELDKNQLAYKRTVPGNDIERIKSLHLILAFIEVLCKKHEYNSGGVRKKNIAKLLKRFPEKFSEAMANNRDLEAELKALTA